MCVCVCVCVCLGEGAGTHCMNTSGVGMTALLRDCTESCDAVPISDAQQPEEAAVWERERMVRSNAATSCDRHR